MWNFFRRSPPSCIFCDIINASAAATTAADATGSATASAPYPPATATTTSTATADGDSSPASSSVSPSILIETASVVAIADKYPAAQHHFLVLPKRHLDNAKCLTKDDSALWEEMTKVARQLVETQIPDERDR